MSKGNPSAGDFVGWTGCGPSALYIENVLGFRPNGSTTCDILHDGTGIDTFTASAPFALVVNGVPNAIPVGQSQIPCAP